MVRRFTFILFFLMLLGCGAVENNEKKQVDQPEDNVGLKETNEPIELELWSHYGGWEYTIDQFEQRHPGVTVKVKLFSFENYSKEFLKALAEKEVPDIMVFDHIHFADFTAMDGLENLAEDPYTLEAYRHHFSPSLWRLGESFDGKRMIGIPISSTPLMTFYRADILEEYGFPSDPEELGVYMENPDNWLEMAKELKKDNKWLIQEQDIAIQIIESTKGIFNQDLEFLRKDEVFKQAIDISRTIRENNLVSPINVWEDNGIETLRNDQFVMFFRGDWGSGEIAGWVPEQSGKWRATRLPFNQYGWANSPIMSIPTESKHKELAWEFLESYSFGADRAINREPDPRKNEFLGGQQDLLLTAKLMEKVEEPKLTPLDDDAHAIWRSTISMGLENDLSTEEILDLVNQNINDQLGREIQYLLRE